MSQNTVTPEVQETESLSIGRIVWRRFVRHKAAMVALVVLVAALILVFTSVGIGPIPGWWKWGWNEQPPLSNPRGEPTMGFVNGAFQFGDHPFGQDEIGRDIFARVMRGAQVSLLVMFVMGIVATVIGVVVGSISGYYRGRLDQILQRATEVVLIIPTIVITAVIGVVAARNGISIFGYELDPKSPGLFGLVLGFVLWPGLSRLVRAEYLSLREREFVDAAKVAGANDAAIIFRHILPNAIGVIIVNATLLMATATILEAALSFLGFGIQAPNVSLGNLISLYQSSFSTRPWLFWFPGIFIVIFALAINLIGDGLRDAFDPRQRRIPKAREMKQDATAKAEKEVGA